MNTQKRRKNGLIQDGLIGQLNHEWEALLRDPATSAALTRWAQQHQVLDSCGTPSGLQEITENAHPELVDEVFVALLSYATDGASSESGLAARILLQLMLPVVVRYAVGLPDVGPWQEREAVAVAAMFETIVTFPLERRQAMVPSNLALDALQLIVRKLAKAQRIAPAFETPLPTVQSDADTQQVWEPADSDQPWCTGDPSAAEELARLLVWAVRGGVITSSEARLLVETAEHGSARAAAERLGVSADVVRQRRHRVIQRLRAAVPDYDPELALADRHEGAETTGHI